MPKLRMTLPKEFTDFCYKHMLDWSTASIEECKEMLLPCDPNARDRGGYKETALHKYIPLEVVEWLVERGADVNIAAHAGHIALFSASRERNCDTVRMLLAHGADLCHHSESWDGHKTPLLDMLSTRSGAWHENNPDIAEVLVNAQKEQRGAFQRRNG